MTESRATTRRGLIAAMAASFAGLAAASAGARPARAPEEDDAPEHPDAPPRKWGMAIDLDLCNGCGGCVVACRSENNVPTPVPGAEHEGTTIEWMSLLPRSASEAEDAAPPVELLPMPCFHCENPPCVKVCPVNATYQNDEGLVVQIWDRCIGCRYCTVACPYERRSFNWTHTEWPEEHRSFMNPDVALRPEGVVEKCTFCSHRIRKAREEARLDGRVLADEELQDLPACAQSCAAEAIVFGDLNDPESRVSRMAASPRSSRLHEHLGTQPKVFYLARDRGRS